MRIDDTIYFSPGLKAIDVDFDNQRQILLAFQRRINEYYLNPARILDGQQQAFATGVILMTTIDAITYYSIGGNDRIKDFIKQTEEVQRFDEPERKRIAKGFDDYFRNGLVHEGRIKSCGQFSYDYNWLINFEDEFFVINPNILLTEVDCYFRSYLRQLSDSPAHYSEFIEKLKRQFKPDIDKMKKIYS